MKVRIRFTKLGRVRWTSHRDVARMWERALRRAGLPVAYTAGFSPRPQLSFGLALPTGCESVAEYLDVSFNRPVPLDTLAGAVEGRLPDGVSVVAVSAIEPGEPSLQEAVDGCTWDISVPEEAGDALDEAVARLLASDALPVRRERKGRMVTDDLRPQILGLVRAGAPDQLHLVADTATKPRGVRPTDLAAALGLELGPARRTSQWMLHDGTRREPLVGDATRASAAMERAS